MVNKKDLSEEDIKNRYITPAITKSQWDLKDMRQELSVTDDKIIFNGNKAVIEKPKRADYVLVYL